MEKQMYERETWNRKLYHDTQLHTKFLQLIIALLLSSKWAPFEPLFSPCLVDLHWNRCTPINILWLEKDCTLTFHFYSIYVSFNHIILQNLFPERADINHPGNLKIVGPLMTKIRAMNNSSAFLLLKLLSTQFFNKDCFTNLTKIAEGTTCRTTF
jgi:hypothetical protein